MAEEKQCVLVVIGADEWGRKEVLGLTDGYRESTQNWRELLLDLKRRGLFRAPELAIGDGALRFWAALREVFGSTREQRCLVHKTGNVLNAMPKSVQPKAKGHLHDIRARPRPRLRPKPPLTASSRHMAWNTTRRPPSWSKIARCCSAVSRLPGRTLETHPHLKPD